MSKKAWIIIYSFGIILSVGMMFLCFLPYDFASIFFVVGLFVAIICGYLLFIEIKSDSKKVLEAVLQDEYETVNLDEDANNPNPFYRTFIRWVSVRNGGLVNINLNINDAEMRIANQNEYYKISINNYYFPTKRHTQSLIRIKNDEVINLSQNTAFYIYIDGNIVANGLIIIPVSK